MKKFLFKSALFALAQGAVLALVLVTWDALRASNYLAATREKHARLESAPAPRIIFIGGSNLPFGIQSELIEREVKRPVVNLGLVAGLGLEFMLNEAREAVRPGDAIVLSLEYDSFSGDFHPQIIQRLLEYRPASIRYLSRRHLRRVLLDRGLFVVGGILRRAFPLAGTATPPPKSDPYCRWGFNQRGDLIAHYQLRPRWTLPNIPTSPAQGREMQFSDQAHVVLADFGRYCEKRGAKFLISFPPYPTEMGRAAESRIAAMEKALATIPNLTLLDRPQDHFYPASAFFDTSYHLTGETARERSLKLARALAPLLRNKAASEEKAE